MDSLDLIKAKILFRLARRRNWGASHTAFDNLKKGLKPKEQELFRQAFEALVRENLLFKKPTGYGLHVSLNHEKAAEIKARIRLFLGVTIL
jgi:hypothetical protein